MKRTILLAALAAFSCTKANAPPDSDRDHVDTPIGAACVNLRRVQCPEGFPDAKTGRTCYEAITVAIDGFAPFPAACVAHAADAAAVRACGDASTIRVRCTP